MAAARLARSRLSPGTGGARATAARRIDLVCRDGGVLVFVEVKARAAERWLPASRGRPAEEARPAPGDQRLPGAS